MVLGVTVLFLLGRFGCGVPAAFLSVRGGVLIVGVALAAWIFRGE